MARVSDCTVRTDLSKDIKENIRCQTGLGVFDNKVIAYMKVNKDLTTLVYLRKLQFVIGETVSVEGTLFQ